MTDQPRPAAGPSAVLDREIAIPRSWGFVAGAAILIVAALVGSFGLFAKADRGGDVTPLGTGLIAGSATVLPSDSSVSPVATTGDAKLLPFGSISDIAVDARGWTYVADSVFGFRMIEPESRIVSAPVARPEAAIAAGDGLTPAVTPDQALYGAQYLAVAGTESVLASSSTRVVRYDRLTNSAVPVAGNGLVSTGRISGAVVPTEVPLSPAGIALASDNATLYVADSLVNTIYVINLVTNEMTPLSLVFPPVPEDVAPMALNQPAGLALNKDNSILYVANEGAKQVLAVKLPTPETPLIDELGTPLPIEVSVLADETKIGAPHDLQFNPIDDTLWLTDTVNARVLRYDLGTGEVAKLLYDPINCDGCNGDPTASTTTTTEPADPEDRIVPIAETGATPAPLSLSFSYDYQALLVGDSVFNRITTYVIHSPDDIARVTRPSTIAWPENDGSLQPVVEETTTTTAPSETPDAPSTPDTTVPATVPEPVTTAPVTTAPAETPTTIAEQQAALSGN